MSPRAGHDRRRLLLFHGSLFDVKCSNFFCKHVQVNNFTDPICPALQLPTEDDIDPSSNEARRAAAEGSSSRELDIADASVALPELSERDLPKCPECNGLLRPGVVWFGERLPTSVMHEVDEFIRSQPVDLVMVIGTSSSVWPAAGYVDDAKQTGARVANINLGGDIPSTGISDEDWNFVGDAAILVPELLRPVVGDVSGMREVLTEGE